MTFDAAREKANAMVRVNNKQIYFIMGKNGQFDVFAGWDARDEALKNGYVFPRYNMRSGTYVTEWDPMDMDIVD